MQHDKGAKSSKNAQRHARNIVWRTGFALALLAAGIGAVGLTDPMLFRTPIGPELQKTTDTLVIDCPASGAAMRAASEDASRSLDECITSALSQDGHVTIYVHPGMHTTRGIRISRSHVALYIPSGAEILLDPMVSVPNVCCGETPLSVLGIYGDPRDPVHDVVVVLEGIIDGNKFIHPRMQGETDQGGVEGINVVYGHNILLVGSGTVQRANGDCIDIDASHRVLVYGLQALECGDSGVHLGSPRPISGSSDVFILGVKSRDHGRWGVSASWPNSHVVIADTVASRNCGNFGVASAWSWVLDSHSTEPMCADRFQGARYAQINETNVSLRSGTLLPTLTPYLRVRLREMRGNEAASFSDEYRVPISAIAAWLVSRTRGELGPVEDEVFRLRQTASELRQTASELRRVGGDTQ